MNVVLISLLILAATSVATAEQPVALKTEAEKLELILKDDPGYLAKPVDPLGNTPLHLAIGSRNLTMIQLLLEKGADLKLRNAAGDSPLHVAVQMNAPDLLAILLASPTTNPDIQDDIGRTPLHTCTNEEVAQLLLDHNANVNAIDLYGNTPLHFGGNNQVPIVQLLLERGADVTARNIIGETPLHTILQRNSINLDIIQSLIEYGADMEAQDYQGLTPVHLTAILRRPRVLQRLLDNGAYVSPISNDGQTPLHYAVLETTHRDIVEILLRNEVDIEAYDANGYTAMDIAKPTSGLPYLLKDYSDHQAPDSLPKREPWSNP